jgi:hypothetical protein
MPESEVEIVRRVMETNRSGAPADTVEAAIALTDPHSEFVSRLTQVEGAAYHGHEGGRRYFADLADAWRTWHNEVHSIEELAPGRVLVESTFHATGQSGVEVALRSAALFIVSDAGLVTGAYVYATREEALAAAEAGP